MASAYATLENDGLYREPTCIKYIVDSDENIICVTELQEVTIYQSDAARTMTDILTTVMDSGTGKTLKLSDMPCAGKTGTTNDHKDGWFCGYTRYYTTCVWVGCDYPKAISDLSGSTYPGKIWKTYMSAVHEGLTPIDFLPYAQLSDDFVNQKKQEEEAHDQMREENEGDGEDDDVQQEETPDDGNTTVNPDDGTNGDDGDDNDNNSNNNNNGNNSSGGNSTGGGSSSGGSTGGGGSSGGSTGGGGSSGGSTGGGGSTGSSSGGNTGGGSTGGGSTGGGSTGGGSTGGGSTGGDDAAQGPVEEDVEP
jgi:membrane peptidoglycan carboxypeptidase